MVNRVAGGEQAGLSEPAQGPWPLTTPPATPPATTERRESRQKIKSKLEYCIYF